MKKVMFVIFIISILLLQGCTDNGSDLDDITNEYSEEILLLEQELEEIKKELEQKRSSEVTLMQTIEELENEVLELSTILENMERLNNNYATLSNISLEFVRAHTEGDSSKLKSLVSNDIVVIEEDDKIYGVYEAYGEEIKYLLYDETRQSYYMDMVIQGYGYNIQNDTYDIHIAEFYDNNSEFVGGYFLTLCFRRFNDGWKIVEFYKDI